VEACTRETSRSANQTAAVEGEHIYTAEGFLCQRVGDPQGQHISRLQKELKKNK
jgi:hypothetical protein